MQNYFLINYNYHIPHPYIIHGTSANIWLSYKQAISTHRNLRQKEINFPFRHLIRHTNPSNSFLKPASSRFRPKNHSYLRKMSILPDCRVFDYSANFSTHDSTVPNKTPRGIPMVLCVRSSVRDCGRVRCQSTHLWEGEHRNLASFAFWIPKIIRKILVRG